MDTFSKFVLVVLCMIFMHIFDDFVLQGVLAKLKQASWWRENYPDANYRHDYIIALIAHAFSWTFCITLPCIFAYGFHWSYIFLFGVTVCMHAYVDNLKANKLEINLWEDQVFHLVQILAVALMYFGGALSA